MIVRRRPSLIDILFAMRGSIVPRILWRLVAMAVLSCLAVTLVHLYPAVLTGAGLTPFTLIGLSLSIFMSFRNNACYDRWWEGRKLWGELTIETRSFARAVDRLETDVRRALFDGLRGFVHGLAARLRGGDEAAAVAARIDPARDWAALPNPTDAALRWVGRRCAQLMVEETIGAIELSVLETRLAAIAHVQGGCERIKATPLPFAFSLLLHRTTYIFCILLPFALAGSLGWWTPCVVILVCYTFFGLDALGDELEDPFGYDVNDLPIEAIARQIERELLAALGTTDLPPPILPVKDLLY